MLITQILNYRFT